MSINLLMTIRHALGRYHIPSVSGWPTQTCLEGRWSARCLLLSPTYQRRLVRAREVSQCWIPSVVEKCGISSDMLYIPLLPLFPLVPPHLQLLT